jgi:hypothetical protein
MEKLKEWQLVAILATMPLPWSKIKRGLEMREENRCIQFYGFDE